MAPPVQARKIAIAGASGSVGSHILPALVAKKSHTITAIQRKESSATYGPEVIVKKGAFDDEDFLVDSLKGQDVLVIVLAIEAFELQDNFIRAAAKAGVEYVLPIEFGSDMESKLADEFPLISKKKAPRKLIEDLGVSSWIAVNTNPWLEFCLANGLLGFNLKERTAQLVNGGNTKFNTSSLPRVGAAVAGLLSLPDADLAQYKNRPFYVTSFHVTQRELFDSILRATKTTEKDWTVKTPTRESIYKDNAEGLKNNDPAAFYAVFLELHLREGYGGDFNHKVDLGKFDLEKEDLDEIIRKTVEANDAVAQ